MTLAAYVLPWRSTFTDPLMPKPVVHLQLPHVSRVLLLLLVSCSDVECGIGQFVGSPLWEVPPHKAQGSEHLFCMSEISV